MAFAAYTPKARVQKPAPPFSGTGVVDGLFEGTYNPTRLHHARSRIAALAAP